MKAGWLILLAGLVGSSVGYGITWSEFRVVETPSTWMEFQAMPQSPGQQDATPIVEGDIPVAYVHDDGKFNFGLMETNTESSHEFKIANHGKAVLTLRKGHSSCRCTISTLADDKEQIDLNPGEDVTVKLDWNTKGKVGKFEQSAEILTNDTAARVIKLEIHGNVLETAVVQPSDLVLSSLTTTGSTEADVRVFSIREDDFELGEYEFIDPVTAPLFEVKTERIPQATIEDPNVKCGWLVHLKIKPGLPLGPLSQRLKIKSTLKSLPEVTVNIAGSVSGDITIVGKGWNNSVGALIVGLVSGDEETSRTLQLHVRGEHREGTQIDIESVSPEFLKVQLGSFKELVPGRISEMPITISIPAGTPACNFSGNGTAPSGEVILTTNHQDVKQVRIKVSFLVQR